MAFYLGVDGGGTGCRAVLTDAGGRVLGRGSAGPANISTDPEGALANILAAARQATGEEVPVGEICAGLGLAGVNAAGTARALAPRLPFAESRIESDAVTAAMGALGPRDGIVAALGTGSVYAVQRAGEIRQIGGHGFTLGDEAGGAWLGRKALSRALRAADGMEPGTPFLTALTTRFGGIASAVGWSVRATPADFARLAPEVAASDDPAAQSILAEATDEIETALRALAAGSAAENDAGDTLPVVLLGGLAPVYAPFLAPRWHLLPAAGTALDGALALARRGKQDE